MNIGHVQDWIDFDAGRFHVDQQQTDSGVSRFVRIRPDQHEHHVGTMAHGRPDLGTVDHELIAVEHCTGLNRRQIGTRVGLRVALAPLDFSTSDRTQMLRPLLVVAERH